MNLLTSGCLIYPIPFLCFEGLSWAMPVEEVREYKIWYEENFIELAEKLHDQGLFDYIYLICGKNKQHFAKKIKP